MSVHDDTVEEMTEIPDLSPSDSALVRRAVLTAIDVADFFVLDADLDRHDRQISRSWPPALLSDSDLAGIRDGIDDPRHHVHAVVALMTLGGNPTADDGSHGHQNEIADEHLPAEAAIVPPNSRSLLQASEAMTEIREQNPWLRRATHRTLHLRNHEYIVELTEGVDRIVVAFNIGDAPMDIEVLGLTGVLAGTATLLRDGIQLRPHGWAVASAVPVE